MSKQTAVEWVIQKLIRSSYLTQGPSNTVNGLKVKRIINQAKAMEEKQAFEFWQGGIKCTEEGGKSFEQYYNETYKQP